MKVVVGLGNPGLKYHHTRHNVGFDVVDELAKRMGVSVTKDQWQALSAETRVGQEKVLLVKPQTYMNNSGESVRAIFQFYQEALPEHDLIVIYDDMDFAVGNFRLRQQGSAGGHNGIKSIINHIQTSEFARVRIGIGRPAPEWTVIDHVLGSFSRTDRKLVDAVVERASDAVVFALENSFSLAMNRFNTSPS
ncbi:aminoacyl-tRNA hydrolase [Alicyclobacillus ferrooxydans]|uniref:Peptidyl-tRNA hydrolase n=1 Tax=Alicyclobacillus ferrooxydans TaxID=471514 RepID=A0A0P9EMM6_9BACL|nr:aminoacyl-tRNA hydrolase [Alicyclobacillus ferrooxydans]KPV44649.1 peptidyl-tRNA hydrolase [Alicyclobacillus ferrooxydans]